MADNYNYDDDPMPVDFPGIEIPGLPVVVKLTVPDDDGTLRTTRWSFPDDRSANLFEAMVRADPYVRTHEHTIEREVAD